LVLRNAGLVGRAGSACFRVISGARSHSALQGVRVADVGGHVAAICRRGAARASTCACSTRRACRACCACCACGACCSYCTCCSCCTCRA
jgi:hypothetical protein